MGKRFMLLSAIALNLIIVAVLITLSANFFIRGTFQELPVVKDLLWEILPYVRFAWISEVFIFLSILYIIIYGLKKDKNYLPYTASLYAIFYIIRAIIITLTPLGFPYQYDGFFSYVNDTLMLGAFPSGHLAIPYLTYMITKNRLPLILAFLTGLFLLLSRGHYSIDLVGTLLVSFVVFKFSERYLKKYFIKE